MPPKKTPTSTKKVPPNKKDGGTDVDDLADQLQGAGVSTKKLAAYSIAIRDPYCIRTFLEDAIRFVEVDVCFGAATGDVTATLAQDGMSISVSRGVFSSFFSTKRLRMALGDDFEKDSSRTSAHRQVWDDFKKKERPQNGLVFSNDVQVIKLPHKCTGLVEQSTIEFIPTKVKCTIPGHLMADGVTQVSPTTHRQFVAVTTFKVMTAEQLEKEKKAAKITVSDWDITNEYDSE